VQEFGDAFLVLSEEQVGGTAASLMEVGSSRKLKVDKGEVIQDSNPFLKRSWEGASGTNTNQNRQDPERAPAGCKPQDGLTACSALIHVEGLEPAGAR